MAAVVVPVPAWSVRLQQAAPQVDAQIQALIRVLAAEAMSHDDVWLIDSTPVECGRSRPTANRSDLAGWAGYGYCASHSRCFWGLRLHLVATPAGLPIAFALANPKADEREIALDMFESDPALLAGRHGQTLIADKGYGQPSSNPASPNTASNSSDPQCIANGHDAASPNSNRSARSSSRSTTP